MTNQIFKTPKVVLCKSGQIRTYNINPDVILKRIIRAKVKNKTTKSLLLELLK